MKYTKNLVFAIACIFSFQLNSAVQAQGFSIGPEAGLILDGTNLMIGVNATKDFEVAGNAIIGNAVVDYFFADFGTLIGIEIAALYDLGEQESFSPYVGGGLSILNYSWDGDSDIPSLDIGYTNTGLLVKGGANFASSGSMVPFAEAALYLDGTNLVVKGGVRFAMGGE